jgi:hypothetical protein
MCFWIRQVALVISNDLQLLQEVISRACEIAFDSIENSPVACENGAESPSTNV